MRTTSKKKVTRKARRPKPDSPQEPASKAPEAIGGAMDALCTQWLTEHKDRTITSLEELVLMSSLALLGGAKQWKVVAQSLILALKIAENDPNVAETLRGALEHLFINLSAEEDEMEFRAKQAKKQVQLDASDLVEGDRVLIQNQRRKKANGMYETRRKKGLRK